MEDKFKIPRSSYDVLERIIKAYGFQDDSASLDDLVRSSGVSKSEISRNNSFLISAGIIENDKTSTQVGKKLALAISNDIVDEIISNWRKIVLSNEFLKKMLQALIIRKGMEESQYINHIAYSAGEAKSARVNSGCRTIIEIFKKSDLIISDNGKLVPNPNISLNILNLPVDEIEDLSEIKTRVEKKGLQSESMLNQTININLNINLDLNNFENDLEKLRSLIESLNNLTSDL